MSQFQSQAPTFERFNNTPPTNVVVKTSTGKMHVDYRNAEVLRRLMSPNGKISSRRRTGQTAFEQRLTSQAIKRARYMALLPYTSATL